MTVNIKKVKHCAFCKYWYDPSNKYIFPNSLDDFLWEFKPNVRRKCLKKDVDTQGVDSCPDYKLKISIEA